MWLVELCGYVCHLFLWGFGKSGWQMRCNRNWRTPVESKKRDFDTVCASVVIVILQDENTFKDFHI